METNTSSPSQTTPGKKSAAVGVKWGFIIGLVGCVITTLSFMVILPRSYATFLVMTFVSFVLTLVLLGFAAAEQRRAQGGFISLKEAFRVIFIAILIVVALNTAYGVLYAKVIDPDSVVRTKEATLSFMERMGTPQSQLDKQAADFDADAAKSTSPARLLMSAGVSVVFYSLFGLLVALIVRRKPPLMGPQ